LYNHKINDEDWLLAMAAPVWFPSNQIFVEIINIIYYNRYKMYYIKYIKIYITYVLQYI